MTFDAPISRCRVKIKPEWADYNGHMNVTWFTHIFDIGTDAFYPLIGLGQPYRETTGNSTFAVEAHITYSREGNIGDEVDVTTQLLGFDDKRIHYFNVMKHAVEGYQMATHEQLALHVDLSARKVVPMPEEPLRLLADLEDAHRLLPIPPEVGSVMRIKSKP